MKLKEQFSLSSAKKLEYERRRLNDAGRYSSYRQSHPPILKHSGEEQQPFSTAYLSGYKHGKKATIHHAIEWIRKQAPSPELAGILISDFIKAMNP